MKKRTKIMGIVILGLLAIGGYLYFDSLKKVEKLGLAQKDADYIIENLDKDIVLQKFPEKNFQNREQLKNIVGGISQNCDWRNRDGKFVDFCTMKEIGGIYSTAFIYEYYLKCDSLRFILIYYMDKDKPELFKMNIEPLKTENKMIIFPEKELKNRK